MVCIFCLVPLFLIPVVNALPLLFDFILYQTGIEQLQDSPFLRKVYELFGWEYRKPARVPPACPYKPKNTEQGTSEEKPTVPPHGTIGECEKRD